MKKTLLLLLPILLLSCSKEDVSSEQLRQQPSLPYLPNILEVPEFTKTDPKYRKEGDYLYFDFVKFEEFDKTIGFTKIDHNVFRANETKDYALVINSDGMISCNISGKPYPEESQPYYIIIEAGSSTEYIKSVCLQKN